MPESWAAFIQELKNKKPELEFAFIGTDSDKKTFAEINSHLPDNLQNAIQEETKHSLATLPEFFSNFDLVIGVDTGPLHIAAVSAYENRYPKIIGLYGPTSAKRTGPYGFDYLSFDEISGQKASHKRTKAKDKNSMEVITAEMLLNKVFELYNLS